jgi:hypothetical protein
MPFSENRFPLFRDMLLAADDNKRPRLDRFISGTRQNMSAACHAKGICFSSAGTPRQFIGSGVRLQSVRTRRAAAFVQELIQFGAISCGAESLQEFLEFSFFVFKPTQRLRTVLIESTIVARRLLPPIPRAAAAAGAVSHPVFPSTPSGVPSPDPPGELRPVPTAKCPAHHERDENDEPNRKPPNEPKDEENETHDATCVQCECK